MLCTFLKTLHFVLCKGFTKEQLRVQVTSTPMLRINGERQILENKRRRFSREFSIPPYCDTNDVSAKFEGGVLIIKFPKLITLARAQPQIAPVKEKEQAQEDRVDKPESLQKEKEPSSDEKEEKKTEGPKENEANSDDKEKGEKKEEVEPKEVTKKKVSTYVPETAQVKPKSKMTQRLKTRVLDFTVSLRSVEDQEVKQGFGGNKYSDLIKRPKILMNIGVAILLVMVLGLYVKNAFRSSSQGGPEFEKFKEF